MANKTTDTDADLDINSDHEATDDEVRELQGGNDTQAGGDDEPDEHEDESEASAKRDTELESATDDTEREAIRERRRNERKNKSQRQRDKAQSQQREIESLKAQLRSVSEQVGGIQSGQLSQSMASLDQEIERAKHAANHFANIAADAVAKQDGKTWREAQEKAEFARGRLNELSTLKTNVQQGMQRQQTQAAPLNPAMVQRARSFHDRNSWYGGPQSNDPDSQVLTTLDNALTREGWDPTTDAYWEELDARKAKYLPHRVQRNADAAGPSGGDRRTPRQPVAGSSSGTSQNTNSDTYRLSTARVQALKDAGMWNDEKQRAKMIAKYQAMDKAAANKR